MSHRSDLSTPLLISVKNYRKKNGGDLLKEENPSTRDKDLVNIGTPFLR